MKNVINGNALLTISAHGLLPFFAAFINLTYIGYYVNCDILFNDHDGYNFFTREKNTGHDGHGKGCHNLMQTFVGYLH